MTYDFMAVGIDANALRGTEAKTLCPQCSHTRKKHAQPCLNVNTETGLYHCWHCEWSGKAPEVSRPYMRVAMDKPKAYTKPTLKAEGLNAAALAWFATRGIAPEVLERNRVTTTKVFMPQVGQEVTAIAFPYLRGGDTINCKYRDREKNFRMAGGAERLLYGMDDIAATTVIVEGEMDKLAVEVAGLRNCVSVPDGAPAPNAKNLESKFDYLGDERLQAVERWVIAVDNDAPGQRLQDELIRRFGAEKCLIATWPDGCKDANDVLLQHGAQGLFDRIEAAEPVPIVGVFGADDFADEFMRMYDEGVPSGLTTGWECIDECWRIKAGQLVIVTGIPGHGKSEWVDALAVNLALDHGWSTAMYSPENHPVSLHMMKLAEKYIGKPMNPGPNLRMTRQEAAAAKDWVAQHFHWLMPEKPSLDEILDKTRALVLRKGVRGLVIDPWNEVENARGGMTESEYVSECLSKLRRFARKHELLVIVVAHPRLMEKKSDGSYPVPTPYDINGGAMWRNKADNCIAIYSPNQTDPNGAVEIHVQKVKFKLFGKVGMVPMRWDRITGRYFPRPIQGKY